MAIFLLAGVAFAQRLEPVGVLGNSGVAGAGLIRVVPTEQPSGVYVAPDSTVWIDGGEAILHVTFDGRLLESRSARTGLRESQLVVVRRAGRNALLLRPHHDKRIRAGWQPGVSLAHGACALPLTPGAVPRVVRPFPDIPDWRGGVLAAQPLNGRLLLAKGREDAAEEEMIVCTLNPGDGQLADFLKPGARTIAGLALDVERSRLYVGGTWPDARSPEIVACDLAGKEVHRTMALQTPANPTQFRGIVSLVGDALWEGAWYGHLGRWNLDLDTAPGTVWTWGLEFNYPCQLVAAGKGSCAQIGPVPFSRMEPLVMSEMDNQHTYLLRWDAATGKVTLGKRIGSLAEVTSLAMSDDGWVTVGSAGRTLWWKWEDDATDPPRAGNHQAGGVNGYFHDGRMVALLPGSDQQRPTAITFEPHAGRGMSQPDHGQFTPFAKPAGLARTAGDPAKPHDHGWAYATDAATAAVWQTQIEGRRGVPIASQWKQLAGSVSLTGAGDVAVLSGGRLAVVDGGAVVLLRLDGEQCIEERRLTGSGAASATASFGRSLRLAADGPNLLVADTDRHRVLWLDAADGRLVAQAGQPDVAGASASAFDHPAAVAVAGQRAVLYDAGNQRIVKLQLCK